jgi:hypothetical protein
MTTTTPTPDATTEASPEAGAAPTAPAILSDADWSAAWGHELTDAPQAFGGLPREAYDQLDGLNASLIKHVILESEAHAWRKMRDPDREQSEDQGAFLVGNITHTCLLEPELFGERYLEIPPDAPNRPTAKQLQGPKPRKDGTVNPETKAYAAWQEAVSRQAWWERFERDNPQATTAQLVPAKELALGRACGQAVLDHPAIGAAFAGEFRNLNELTLTWRDPVTGRRMKCRLDALRLMNDRLWVGDLKTALCAAPGPDGFARDAERHGYLLSAAFYLDATFHCREALERLMVLPEGALIGIERRFEWIAIEKDCPRPDFVGRYFMNDDQLEAARPVVRQGIDRVVQAEITGWWPGYDTAAKPLELPGYGYSRLQRLAEVLA